MFRAVFSPIIRNTWLYLQYLVMFTQVAAGWRRQQLGWTLPDTVNTVKCSWWWMKTLPETCTADSNNKLIYVAHLFSYFHRRLEYLSAYNRAGYGVGASPTLYARFPSESPLAAQFGISPLIRCKFCHEPDLIIYMPYWTPITQFHTWSSIHIPFRVRFAMFV
jgi:hypothetical protein